MTSTSKAPARNLWPIGIVAAFAVFIAATAGLIVFSVFHRVDLVCEDYYEQEVRYQEQIDRRDRTHRLTEEAAIAVNNAEQRIVVSLPGDHGAETPTGTIHLYRPSSAELDRKYRLEVDSEGRQTIESNTLETGLWRVRVTWQTGGQEFYSERDLVIGADAS